MTAGIFLRRPEPATSAFYKLLAVYSEHERDGPQIELLNLCPVKDSDSAEGFDPAALVEMPPQEPTLLLGELQALAMVHIGHEGHRGLVLFLLEKHAEALLRLPATRDRGLSLPRRAARAYVTVTKSPPTRDPLRGPPSQTSPPPQPRPDHAGAVLHDIGRVLELGEESPIPSAGQSRAGSPGRSFWDGTSSATPPANGRRPSRTGWACSNTSC